MKHTRPLLGTVALLTAVPASFATEGGGSVCPDHSLQLAQRGNAALDQNRHVVQKVSP